MVAGPAAATSARSVLISFPTSEAVFTAASGVATGSNFGTSISHEQRHPRDSTAPNADANLPSIQVRASDAFVTSSVHNLAIADADAKSYV